MKIAIAGPYSANTQAERQHNLDRLNRAAAQVYLKGHILLIGVNAALPVVDMLENENRYEAIMNISMATIENCDALLLIGESPGALRERDIMMNTGKIIYTNIEDIPSH